MEYIKSVGFAAKPVSEKVCHLCGRPVVVRDTRQVPYLCGNCQPFRNELLRFYTGRLFNMTPEEKQKILQTRTAHRPAPGTKYWGRKESN